MRSFSKILMMVVATMVLMGSSFAQSPQRYRTNIPFDFAVNGKNLPAGDYTVTINSAAHIVTFDNAKQLINASALYRVNNASSADKTLKLQFSVENSFTGFRAAEAGGATLGTSSQALAKNAKSSTGRGSAD